MDLHQEGEMVDNVDTTFLTRAAHTDNHGTRMTSIIAARANDSSGITGLMWNARVAMADISEYQKNGQPVLHPNGLRKSDTSVILKALYELVWHGARVINLSVGSDSARTGPHTPAQDSARANYGRAFSEASSYTPPGGLRPLWVISAGNMQNATDVYWNDVAGAAGSLPNETLIVTGASARAGHLLSTSTGTGAINIAAPGEQVAVSDGAGTWAVTGSSPATALVSGAAGLLFAFDSTITADSAREWLVRAAKNSGRKAGNYPLLDTYGALRIAAERPGTPICGNRVWAGADNAVYAQRTPSGPELLFTAGSNPGNAALLNVHQGGRRIELHNSSLAYDLVNGSWRAGTFSGLDAANWSGAFKGSILMQDKEDKFTTGLTAYWNDEGIRFKAVRIGVSPGFTNDSVTTVTMSMSLNGSLTSECVRQNLQVDSTYFCMGSALVGTREYLMPNPFTPEPVFASAPELLTNEGWGHALDPQGRFVIVPVLVSQVSVQYDTAWSPCPGGDGGYFPVIRCRTRTKNEITNVRTDLIRINLATGAAVKLETPSLASGDEVLFLSVNEKGQELAMQVASVTMDATSGEIVACSGERYLWLSFSPYSGASTSPAFSRPMTGGSVCSMAAYGAIGAFLRSNRSGLLRVKAP